MDKERLDLIIQEREGRHKYTGRRYFDAPDGEDLLGKLMVATKYGASAGLMWSFLSILNKPVTKSFKEMIFRTFKYTTPIVAMAQAFTVTTFFASRCWPKEQILNYTLGSVAAGTVVGYSMGRFGVGVTASLLIAALSNMSKHTYDLGRLNEPLMTFTTGPYLQRKMNMSFYEQRKGNWTSTPPE